MTVAALQHMGGILWLKQNEEEEEEEEEEDQTSWHDWIQFFQP